MSQTLTSLVQALDRRPPLRYAISNRDLFPRRDRIGYLISLFAAPADLIQLREKDLNRSALRPLVKAGVRLADHARRIFLVNSDFELAIAEGAHGVHLPGPASIKDAIEARDRAGLERFLIGKSVHSVGEAIAAAADGADYLLLGPVFAPISKPSGTEPIGLSALAEAVAKVPVPIFALGGMDANREREVLETGVIGTAGISWVHRYLG